MKTTGRLLIPVLATAAIAGGAMAATADQATAASGCQLTYLPCPGAYQAPAPSSHVRLIIGPNGRRKVCLYTRHVTLCRWVAPPRRR